MATILASATIMHMVSWLIVCSLTRCYIDLYPTISCVIIYGQLDAIIVIRNHPVRIGVGSNDK
eukprot:scaffold2058_cov403-Prasinococcus_capsulatus_cf.AAC.12